MDFIRDHAMYAAIFGFFAMVWFGWAQEQPPKSWRMWLGLGSVASTALCIAGVYLAVTHWHDATALSSRNTYWMFGAIVAAEVASAGIGAAVLVHKNMKDYVAAWIALVVGAHFLPLAWIFRDDSLYALTALVCAAPIVAIVLAKKTGLALSAITGTLTGTILLGFAIRGLAMVLASSSSQ